MPAVVRWTLYDPIELVTYTFHINPFEGGSPQFRKKVNYQSTSAPDGLTLIFEGQDEVQEITWEGTILEQAHYDALYEWWAKRRQLLLTDDMGREFWVYLQTFEPKRVRAAHHPWKHTYSMKAVILDWELVG
jgi:hypothetical protein